MFGMGPLCIYIVLSNVCCWISAVLEIGFFIFETFKFPSGGDVTVAQLSANVKIIIIITSRTYKSYTVYCSESFYLKRNIIVVL